MDIHWANFSKLLFAPVVRRSSIALISYLLVVSGRKVRIPRNNHLSWIVWFWRLDTLRPWDERELDITLVKHLDTHRHTGGEWLLQTNSDRPGTEQRNGRKTTHFRAQIVDQKSRTWTCRLYCVAHLIYLRLIVGFSTMNWKALVE